jgi:uncharacterized protein
MTHFSRQRIVVDNIHGDIELTDEEWRIVDTPSFQRLRNLKQLGLGHLTYPNATHTRFAHSLGVLKIMSRIVEAPGLHLEDQDKRDLRVAALLHDIGHYPYSHLMEGVDNVQLTEEVTATRFEKNKTKLDTDRGYYPDHETLGRHIVGTQSDILNILGGSERASNIGHLFSRTKAADQQKSKLIHSSLDMDRLDYLLRDARAAGVPYGEIDLNYLLTNVRRSDGGLVGVEYKALAAAEQFLLARVFMHRTVYYHKTTYGFEESCRQLLRRLKDLEFPGVPLDGKAIMDMAGGSRLLEFTDAFVDDIIRRASTHTNFVVKALADSILSRKAPRLIAEVSGLEDRKNGFHRGFDFEKDCRRHLPEMAKQVDLPLGQFLLCSPKPITFEKRGGQLTSEEARSAGPPESEELIMVFPRSGGEPKSIVDWAETVIGKLATHVFGIHRLYLVDTSVEADRRVKKLRESIKDWSSLSNR